jgi:hypothetical protein
LPTSTLFFTIHQQVSNLHVSFCALFALLVIRVNLVKHKKWKSEKAKKRQEVKSEEALPKLNLSYLMKTIKMEFHDTNK